MTTGGEKETTTFVMDTGLQLALMFVPGVSDFIVSECNRHNNMAFYVIARRIQTQQMAAFMALNIFCVWQGMCSYFELSHRANIAQVDVDVVGLWLGAWVVWTLFALFYSVRCFATFYDGWVRQYGPICIIRRTKNLS